jgi:regulator of protease activity HflC (stomatin/prohibitin superfamily)
MRDPYFSFLHGNDQRPLRVGRRAVVRQWEQALLFRHGALVDTLGPGAHRRWRRGYTFTRVDMRPSVLTVPTQEVPTADGVTVKITVAGAIRITEPAAYVTASQDAMGALYLAVQIALREVVAGASVEQLVGDRGQIGTALRAAISGTDALGLEIERIDAKDIVLSSELKRAQAEVLLARAEGQAALERARGETAALRSLANAARLVADNPALLQLRLYQQLGAGGTNTVVLGQS